MISRRSFFHFFFSVPWEPWLKIFGVPFESFFGLSPRKDLIEYGFRPSVKELVSVIRHRFTGQMGFTVLLELVTARIARITRFEVPFHPP